MEVMEGGGGSDGGWEVWVLEGHFAVHVCSFEGPAAGLEVEGGGHDFDEASLGGGGGLMFGEEVGQDGFEEGIGFEGGIGGGGGEAVFMTVG